MPIQPGAQIVLCNAAQLRFPDIGSRPGKLLRIDGWAITAWQGIIGETRLPLDLLEPLPQALAF